MMSVRNAVISPYRPRRFFAWALATIVLLSGLAVYTFTRDGTIVATTLLGIPAFPWMPLALPAVIAGSWPTFAHAYGFTALTVAATSGTHKALALSAACFSRPANSAATSPGSASA